MRSGTTPDVERTGETAGDPHKRGVALLVGGIVMMVLIETELVPFYWVVLMVGLTYLAAAAASGGRGSLWAPGMMLTIAGLAIAFWIQGGRPPRSLQFLGLTVLALGAGAVLASLLNRVGCNITAMSVAMTLVAFGGFVLAAQQGIFTRNIYVYGGLLIVWGLVGMTKTLRASIPRLRARPDNAVG